MTSLTWFWEVLCVHKYICHQRRTWGQRSLGCQTPSLETEPQSRSRRTLGKANSPTQRQTGGFSHFRGNWCFCFIVLNNKWDLPVERSLHITDGVAKHAKTSSVQVKCVRWGNTIDWPRHWPHMYTWPLWVFATDVCVEWQAPTSTILWTKPERGRRRRRRETSLVICRRGRAHLSFSVMTWTGLSWLFLLPVPSCPYVLAPQAKSKPSSVSASEWA